MYKRILAPVMVVLLLGVVMTTAPTRAAQPPDFRADPTRGWPEDLSARTHNTKVFVNPTNPAEKVRAVGVGAIHYMDPETKRWTEPVYTPIRTAEEFRFNKVGAPLAMPFQADGMVTVDLNLGYFAFAPVNANPVAAQVRQLHAGDGAAVYERHGITYDQLFPGVTITYEPLLYGVKEIITLTGPGHPNQFVFRYDTNLGVEEKEDGGLLLRDLVYGYPAGEIAPPYIVAPEGRRVGSFRLVGQNSIQLDLPDLSDLEYPIEIDPTIAGVVEDSCDDRDAYTSGYLYACVYGDMYFGRAYNYDYRAYVRFTDSYFGSSNLSDAFVRLVAYSTRGTAGETSKVSIVAALNDSSQPTSYDDWNSRATTNQVVWSPGPWVAGEIYDTPDLEDVVKEVMRYGSYNYDLLLMFNVWHNESAENSYRVARTYDYGQPAVLYYLLTETGAHGYSYDTIGDVVLGQPNLNEISVNKMDPAFTWDPADVESDPNVHGGHNYVYVVDTNQAVRVGYLEADTAGLGDAVQFHYSHTIGEPGTCNGATSDWDGTYTWPKDTAFCGKPADVESVLESPWGANMDVFGGTTPSDLSGALAVVDTFNNRVLVFKNPWENTTDGKTADYVIGQVNMIFGHNLNYGGCYRGSGFETPTQNGLCFYWRSHGDGEAGSGVAGVAFAPDGDLWISDPPANRVLRFDWNGSGYDANANFVLGQDDFATRVTDGCASDDPWNPRRLCDPTDVAVDGSGNVYVAMRGGGSIPGRIVRFNAPFNGTYKVEGDIVWDGTALMLPGDPDILTIDRNTTDGGLGVVEHIDWDPEFDKLWIVDRSNRQVLLYDPGYAQTDNPAGAVYRVLATDEAHWFLDDCSGCVEGFGTNRTLSWQSAGAGNPGPILRPDGTLVGVEALPGNNGYLLSVTGNSHQNVFRYPNGDQGGLPAPQDNQVWSVDARLFTRYESGMRNKRVKAEANGFGWNGIDILEHKAWAWDTWLYATSHGYVYAYRHPHENTTGQPPYTIYGGHPLTLRTADQYGMLPSIEGGQHPGAIDIDRYDSSYNNPILWVAIESGGIHGYNAPLPMGSNPVSVASLTGSLPIIGTGESIPLGGDGEKLKAIVAKDTRDPWGQGYIWATQDYRAFRIRNPLADPDNTINGGQPYVDVVIGYLPSEQNGAPYYGNIPCFTPLDPGGTGIVADRVCSPVGLTLDRYDNVFIADRSSESPGFNRVTQYDAGRFPLDLTSAVHVGLPDRVLTTNGGRTDRPADYAAGAFTLHFDKTDRLLIGSTFYGDRKGVVPLVDEAPMYVDQPTQPEDTFADWASLIGAFAEDEYYNVYWSDANRSRIWRLNQPFPYQHGGISNTTCSSTQYEELTYNLTNHDATQGVHALVTETWRNPYDPNYDRYANVAHEYYLSPGQTRTITTTYPGNVDGWDLRRLTVGAAKASYTVSISQMSSVCR